MKKKVLSFITDGKRFLALRNNPSEPEKHGGDFWFTVTGGVEKDESFEDAVKREVLEETGLIVKKLISLNWSCIYNDWTGENEEDYYLAFVFKGKVKLSEEHIDYTWYSFSEFLKKISWEGNKKELERILQNSLNKKIPNWKTVDDFINRNRVIFHKGRKYIIKWFLDNDFSKLDRKKVTQVYGIVFDNLGKIMVVDVRRRDNWSIPGGGIEGNENYEETLRRECMEEADIEISDIKPLGYNIVLETNNEGKEKKYYQLRYAAKIAKLHKQTVDVATGVIPVRKLIKPEDFAFYCPLGFQGDEMIDAVLNMM